MSFLRKHIKLLSLTGALLCFLVWVNTHYKVYTLSLEPQVTSISLSIMTFNINALHTKDLSDNDIQKLLQIIDEESPSIICFQEISNANLDILRPALDSIYGECDSLSGWKLVWRGHFYSKLPLRNLKRYHCEGDIDTIGFDSTSIKEYKLIKRQMPMMSAEFEVEPNKWVTLYSGHLRSSAYSTARRSMDKEESWFKGIPLYLRNYKNGKAIRNYEAANIRRHIDEAISAGKPVIVAGDLNDWCGSDCLETLIGNELKEAWWEGGNGFGWTYFGWNLRLRLDHILYSDELELVDVEVVDTDISDHKPLMARFRVK